MTKPREMLPQSIRFSVFRRDDFSCRYCGRSSPTVTLHVDHVQPVSDGGSDDIDNLVTSCRACNLSKGAKTGINPPSLQPRQTEPPVSDHPLVNIYGHTLTIDGEYQYQFKIIGAVNADKTIFAVQFFSWMDGRDTEIHFIDIDDLMTETKCTLYGSQREWQFRGDNQDHDRAFRHRRARGETKSFKPGTDRFYKNPEEMSEQIKRDHERRQSY